MKPWYILILTAFAVLAPTAHAQSDPADIDVTAEVDRRRVYVGDRVQYVITVSGSNSAQVPEVDLPDGVIGQFLGGRERSSSFTTFINGRQRTRTNVAYVFTYTLSPQREGEFTLGPAQVVVGGVTYETGTVTLSAIQPQDVSADYPIRVETDRTDLWVGEAVRLRVTWAFHPDIENPSFDVTTMPEGVRVLENRTPPTWTGAQERRLGTILGQDIIMDFGTTTLDGRAVRTLSFELLVTPIEPGNYDLGPVGVVFDRVVRGRGRVRVISRAEPIAVTARTLPTEGQPRGFSGMVGSYAVRSEVSTQAANVGDPIELEVRIEGTEPMIGVDDGPTLASQPAFAEGFQLDADGWESVPTEIPGRRLFRTTVRPTSDGVTEIPSVELPYFDAALGEYRIARSEPIPLEVRSVRETTAADALRTGIPMPSRRIPLDGSGEAFWAHERGPGVLTPDGFDPIGRVTEPVWLGLILAPPIGWAGALVLVAAARTRDPDAARRRAALRHANATTRSVNASAGARRLVADLLGRDEASVTAADCDDLAIDPETRDGLVTLIGTDEATRFGGLPPSMPDSARARQLFREAHRQQMGAAR